MKELTPSKARKKARDAKVIGLFDGLRKSGISGRQSARQIGELLDMTPRNVYYIIKTAKEHGNQGV